MTKRYRLKTRAQLHGEVRDPGYIFTLGEGEIGPHRTVVASQHGAQIVDHIAGTQELVDEPLYEPLSDKENAAMDEAEAKKIAEADAHSDASSNAKDDLLDD